MLRIGTERISSNILKVYNCVYNSESELIRRTLEQQWPNNSPIINNYHCQMLGHEVTIASN